MINIYASHFLFNIFLAEKNLPSYSSTMQKQYLIKKIKSPLPFGAGFFPIRNDLKKLNKIMIDMG